MEGIASNNGIFCANASNGNRATIPASTARVAIAKGNAPFEGFSVAPFKSEQSSSAVAFLLSINWTC